MLLTYSTGDQSNSMKSCSLLLLLPLSPLLGNYQLFFLNYLFLFASHFYSVWLHFQFYPYFNLYFNLYPCPSSFSLSHTQIHAHTITNFCLITLVHRLSLQPSLPPFSFQPFLPPPHPSCNPCHPLPFYTVQCPL